MCYNDPLDNQPFCVNTVLNMYVQEQFEFTLCTVCVHAYYSMLMLCTCTYDCTYYHTYTSTLYDVPVRYTVIHSTIRVRQIHVLQ